MATKSLPLAWFLPKTSFFRRSDDLFQFRSDRSRAPRVLERRYLPSNLHPHPPEKSSGILLPQDFLHLLTFRQLINQLIQIADLLHQRILDRFDAHPAHHPLDQRAVRMDRWSLSKKGFKIVSLFDLFLQTGLVITCQPANNLVNFCFRAVFAFRFLNV